MKKQIALIIVAILVLAATSIAAARIAPASMNASFDASIYVYSR